MKIITVAPLSKAIFKENLTYFSAQDLEIGSIVLIPLRNKIIEALVTETHETENLKSELRSSDYPLKKIKAVKYKNFFAPGFIETAQKTADFFVVPLGQVIKSFTPLALLSSSTSKTKEQKNDRTEKNEKNSASKTKIEKFVLQEPDEDRLALYKKLIREAFAQKQSVFLCAPTNHDIGRLAQTLSRGIEDYVFVLRSDDPPKKQLTNWKKTASADHPILIIATPLFLSLSRPDIKTFIVERENATAYKQLTRPFIDARFFIEKLAESQRVKIVLGDILLRSETIERSRNGELAPLSPITYRSFTSAQKQILINLKEKKAQAIDFGLAVSEELATLISQTDPNERWFIFSGRRGLNPLTVCGDCGYTFSCPHCHIPLTLHQPKSNIKKSTENYFLCHKCGHVSSPEDKCRHCGGWKLALLGSGTEKIEAELKKLLPQAKIWRLDSDQVKTGQKTVEIIRDFYSSPGAILIGTEMALFHLTEKIENIAITSIDAYFSIPEFRINEKVFNILLRLRHLAVKNFVIQTRNSEEEVLSLALNGNSTEFHRRELLERKKLKYPPFSLLIKISVKSSHLALVEALETLKEEHLTPWQTVIYDSFGPASLNHEATTNLLLRLPTTDWPKKEILDLLRQLPPTFVINVDPENIF
ncbi:MAG: Primosomal protein N' [Parcubacteria group bacterium GW2011_GWC1_43_11b]|uniref:Primosomal protein N' 3' DNA-binding domain-containing protein n=1 Tax=Candidatus Vogelbacteria bacterium RIFOXYB1_FULL_42_16 TaxID=1802436 RepID=A0A1G2QEX3_9BACT|nr:MAG: Primosomal protein N' [Parcubacteria group bacterium GW2011_GWB1_42_9]KKS89506.1 MAG: Primosomal protein N' [Parcubacteria group bacterium GW2011_GWC1_43_11b]KKT10139.1 MAG: Primosomal protein N' [Parcubacteria group bacterium GW2011_GWA1_43_21]OHA59027.1 MAG: hypothetical protein A2370_00710 [Candidatus Vogelbacteria bacterium RIFOXYB1_FULL_42_16]